MGATGALARIALAGAVLAFAQMLNTVAHATQECLSAPDKTAPRGSHWYYRLDRANGRKCWYLGPEGKKTRPEPPQVQAAAPPSQAPAASPALMPEPVNPPGDLPTAALQARERAPDRSALQPPAPLQHPPSAPTSPLQRPSSQATPILSPWPDESARVHDADATPGDAHIVLPSPAAQDVAVVKSARIEARDKRRGIDPQPQQTTAAPHAVAPHATTLMQMLLAAAAALAAAGLCVRAIVKIVLARRRRVLVDPGRIDRWATSAPERPTDSGHKTRRPFFIPASAADLARASLVPAEPRQQARNPMSIDEHLREVLRALERHRAA